MRQSLRRILFHWAICYPIISFSTNYYDLLYFLLLDFKSFDFSPFILRRQHLLMLFLLLIATICCKICLRAFHSTLIIITWSNAFNFPFAFFLLSIYNKNVNKMNFCFRLASNDKNIFLWNSHFECINWIFVNITWAQDIIWARNNAWFDFTWLSWEWNAHFFALDKIFYYYYHHQQCH